MSTLTIEIKNVRRAYKGADTSVKKTLKDLFPDVSFSDNIIDQVKTFEDACELLSLAPTSVLVGLTEPDEIAYRKLKIIAQALNEGWKPNWNDSNEYKYYAYFNMQNGFSYGGYVRWYQYSNVGSRLCFRTAELAKYAGEQFIAEYNDFLLLKK